MACCQYGRSKISFKTLTGKSTGNRPPRRPKPIWGDNIKIVLKEIDITPRKWISFAQDTDY